MPVLTFFFKSTNMVRRSRVLSTEMIMSWGKIRYPPFMSQVVHSQLIGVWIGPMFTVLACDRQDPAGGLSSVSRSTNLPRINMRTVLMSSAAPVLSPVADTAELWGLGNEVERWHPSVRLALSLAYTRNRYFFLNLDHLLYFVMLLIDV